MDKFIAADLADAQQCKATEMIKFLLVLRQSGNVKTPFMTSGCWDMLSGREASKL